MKTLMISFDEIISVYGKQSKDFFFIQIGAHNGNCQDPLFPYIKKYKWNGILIEPQKDVFKQLKLHYKDNPKIKVVNVAISSKNEVRKLYKIAYSTKNWATLLASFSKKYLQDALKGKYVKDNMKKEGESFPKNIDEWITFEEVQCLTLNELLNIHKIEKIDLLQIDTEGFDYEIIRSIDFTKTRSNIIRYEHKNLTLKKQKKCARFLKQKGYALIRDKEDTLAYLKMGPFSIGQRLRIVLTNIMR